MGGFTLSAVCLLALFLKALASVDLPGMDMLAAGYDAASWMKLAKYRIFDLSVPGAQVHIDAIGKTFTAPAVVSVVSDGPQCRRVEDSCEGVATDFASYLHTHEESTSFDVGIHSHNFSLGLSYHKDVQEVYRSITEKGQAVGVSESWWGMFEATLPPPFLMASHLHPMFAQAKSALKAIETPKTDADQAIYNQVCCGSASFGTHFVASVIVGGRATITSFVNSSFHSEFSQRTVEEQVSIGFMYEKLSAQLDHKAKDFEQKMMKEFKNSSHWRYTWEPSPAGIENASAPWLVWERAAMATPTVVNISVSSLAGLFYDLPDVMTHMQKTIDFYIQHNRAPLLREVQNEATQPPIAPSSVPGLDIVGCGFHAPTLTSRRCLFDASTPGSTWSNPFYPNISYAVPRGFFARDTPESTGLNGSVIMQTVDDYVQHSYWEEEHHSSGFLGFGSKSEHKVTEKYFRNFYAHRYSLVLSMRQVAWFTLELVAFPLPEFSPMADMALRALPTHYDPSNATAKTMFQQFFEAFGTHVATKADMGGLVWAESWFESCLSRMYDAVCITDEATQGWWVFHTHHDKHTCDKRITEDFEKYSSRHYEMLGGTSNVSIDRWNTWALTVKNDPRPVKMSLAPISYFLSDSHPAKAALEQATLAFLKGAEVDKKHIVDELEKIRPPPAEVCDRVDQTQAPEANPTPPQKTLCPIVGYHGAYCPAVVSDTDAGSSSSGDATRLPMGVGLTIDVSDGELRLPAWKFDFADASTTWMDPASNQEFVLPRGLKLSTDIHNENVATVRVFKTEEDLVDVWEGAYSKGFWLGGEFGNSKSVADLFAKFFSREQSTSINQHPAALYRLTLEAGWEANLNSFALDALKALPASYDSNVYGRFLDAWGTHVANDTLVGGMMEQQVAMKDCMWNDPYLSGGLSDEQLQTYLAMDLAKSPTTDPFYVSRRQISLDHRIGGNPELTDQSAWLSSISKDPALLKIYSYQEWSEVATRTKAVSAVVAANLHKAVADRMGRAAALRAADKATTAKARVAQLQGPRPVTAVVAHGRRGTISPQEEVGQVLTMKSFSDCPSGLSDSVSSQRCSTGVSIHSWNTHELTTPLRYERTADGKFRSVRCFDLDGADHCIEHAGPLITKGCSMQPFADGRPRDFHTPVPDSTVVAAVCADCQVIASGFAQDATLKCECSGYAAVQNRDPVPPSCTDTRWGRLRNYKQCDPRWKCVPYAGHEGESTCTKSECRSGGPANQSNNICGSGCGITSAAMVLSFLMQGKDVLPPQVASWLVDAGYRDDLDTNSTPGATCDGVSHAGLCAVAHAGGFACQQSDTFGDLDQWLADGPVIAHVRHRRWTKPDSCKFTHAGHYIVIASKNVTSGAYRVSDPNSCDEENMHATVQELSEQCALVSFVRIFSDTTEPANYQVLVL